jgi:hypothetical protein
MKLGYARDTRISLALGSFFLAFMALLCVIGVGWYLGQTTIPLLSHINIRSLGLFFLSTFAAKILMLREASISIRTSKRAINSITEISFMLSCVSFFWAAGIFIWITQSYGHPNHWFVVSNIPLAFFLFSMPAVDIYNMCYLMQRPAA